MYSFLFVLLCLGPRSIAEEDFHLLLSRDVNKNIVVPKNINLSWQGLLLEKLWLRLLHQHSARGSQRTLPVVLLIWLARSQRFPYWTLA